MSDTKPKIRLGVISNTPFLDALQLGKHAIAFVIDPALADPAYDPEWCIDGTLVVADPLGVLIRTELGNQFLPWTSVRNLFQEAT